MRVNLQPAYILHSRPYRDSSSLLEVFTAEHGRLSLVARGARRKTRGGSNAALLQPFIPLLLSFAGRGEMKNLVATEAAAGPVGLRGERLYSALYVNELLMRLLHRHDPHPALFATYALTLERLAGSAALEDALRRFEYGLLDELGYSFDLENDAHSGEPVLADRWYDYYPGEGMVLRAGVHEPARPAYAGGDLLAMAAGEFGGNARVSAKKLLRQALAEHLGAVPLRSRELFRTRSTARPGGLRDSTRQQGDNHTGDKT